MKFFFVCMPGRENAQWPADWRGEKLTSLKEAVDVLSPRPTMQPFVSLLVDVLIDDTPVLSALRVSHPHAPMTIAELANNEKDSLLFSPQIPLSVLPRRFYLKMFGGATVSYEQLTREECRVHRCSFYSGALGAVAGRLYHRRAGAPQEGDLEVEAVAGAVEEGTWRIGACATNPLICVLDWDFPDAWKDSNIIGPGRMLGSMLESEPAWYFLDPILGRFSNGSAGARYALHQHACGTQSEVSFAESLLIGRPQGTESSEVDWRDPLSESPWRAALAMEHVGGELYVNQYGRCKDGEPQANFRWRRRSGIPPTEAAERLITACLTALGWREDKGGSFGPMVAPPKRPPDRIIQRTTEAPALDVTADASAANVSKALKSACERDWGKTLIDAMGDVDPAVKSAAEAALRTIAARLSLVRDAFEAVWQGLKMEKENEDLKAEAILGISFGGSEGGILAEFSRCCMAPRMPMRVELTPFDDRDTRMCGERAAAGRTEWESGYLDLLETLDEGAVEFFGNIVAALETPRDKAFQIVYRRSWHEEYYKALFTTSADASLRFRFRVPGFVLDRWRLDEGTLDYDLPGNEYIAEERVRY